MKKVHKVNKAKKIIYGTLVGACIASLITSVYTYASLNKLFKGFEIEFDESDNF